MTATATAPKTNVLGAIVFVHVLIRTHNTVEQLKAVPTVVVPALERYMQETPEGDSVTIHPSPVTGRRHIVYIDGVEPNSILRNADQGNSKDMNRMIQKLYREYDLGGSRNMPGSMTALFGPRTASMLRTFMQKTAIEYARMQGSKYLTMTQARHLVDICRPDTPEAMAIDGLDPAVFGITPKSPDSGVLGMHDDEWVALLYDGLNHNRTMEHCHELIRKARITPVTREVISEVLELQPHEVAFLEFAADFLDRRGMLAQVLDVDVDLRSDSEPEDPKSAADAEHAKPAAEPGEAKPAPKPVLSRLAKPDQSK